MTVLTARAPYIDQMSSDNLFFDKDRARLATDVFPSLMLPPLGFGAEWVRACLPKQVWSQPTKD